MRSFRGNVLLALAILLPGLAVAEPVAIEFEPPLEHRAYPVGVRISATFNTPALIETQQELAVALERTIGAAWTIEWTTAPDSGWTTTTAWRELRREPPTDLPANHAAEFYIRLTKSTIGTIAEICHWEPLSESWSAVETVTTADPRTLPDDIARACRRQFRPRCRWEKTSDTAVRLRVQGAAFGGTPLTTPTDIFVPWVIFRSRDKAIERRLPQPWTYLVTTSLDDGVGAARVASGLRSPLSLKPRGRVEFWGIAAIPGWAATTIRCERQTKPPTPLAAHAVVIEPDHEPTNEEQQTDADAAVTVLTNRQGELTLPRNAHQLQWLSITSGSLLLARLPVLPGEYAERTILLPDDTLRLAVEGDLQRLETDLVALVAARATLINLTRAAAKRNAWETVDARLAELSKLPGRQQFQERISAIRVPAIAAARQRKERTAELRIARQCQEAEELLTRYLDEDKLKLLQEEMRELKSAVGEPVPPK
jgi:hypothetical protein